MAYQKLTPIIATGSTAPRYLGDRFSDVVNLKDFGAAGDGETDDSTAWAAWKTAISTKGMPYIPSGDYVLGQDIVHVPFGSIGFSSKNPTYEDDGQVLDLVSTHIYVDGVNGDNDNIGNIEIEPKKTISNAISAARNNAGGIKQLHIASGEYTENIELNNGDVYYISLKGNVTINGKIEISGASSVIIDGAYVLTVKTASVSNAILVADNSLLACKNTDIEINATSITDYIVLVKNFSHIHAKTIDISGSSCVGGVKCTCSSAVIIDTSLKQANILSTGAERAVFVENGSNFFIRGSGSQIHSGPSAENVLAINGSVIVFDNGITITNHSSSSPVISSLHGSTTWINGATITANTCSCIFDSSYNGEIILAGTIALSGAVSNSTFNAYNYGLGVVFGSFSGSVTGRRYISDNCSLIQTFGGGANKIPGSVSGLAFGERYSLYL